MREYDPTDDPMDALHIAEIIRKRGAQEENERLAKIFTSEYPHSMFRANEVAQIIKARRVE